MGIWTLWSPRELLQSKVCLTKVVGIGESDSLDQFLDSQGHQGEAGGPNLGIWTLWSPRELLQGKVYLTQVVGTGESDSLDQFLDGH